MEEINGRHKGKAIYIIGGGPSLKGFDLKQLSGKVTIACNKAAFLFDAIYMAYMDDQFYDWHESEIKDFKGMVFSHSWNKYRAGVTFAKNLGCFGLSDRLETGLFHGGNAGYLALSLAYVMGGDPIYLLGIDMCYRDGNTHFHDGYKKEDVIGEKRFDHMIKAFDYGSEILKEKGVKVYNCSNISKLTCFEKRKLII